jgi:hypothetical protein
VVDVEVLPFSLDRPPLFNTPLLGGFSPSLSAESSSSSLDELELEPESARDLGDEEGGEEEEDVAELVSSSFSSVAPDLWTGAACTLACTGSSSLSGAPTASLTTSLTEMSDDGNGSASARSWPTRRPTRTSRTPCAITATRLARSKNPRGEKTIARSVVLVLLRT